MPDRTDPPRMALLSPIDALIGLVIFGTGVAVLHAVATDIKNTYMRIDLARKVIERRERYLRELRGDFEEGEVEIFEEDNPGAPTHEVRAEAERAAA